MAYFNPNQGQINDLLTQMYGHGSGQVYTSSTPQSSLPSNIRAAMKLNGLQARSGEGHQDVYNDFSAFDLKYIPRGGGHMSNAKTGHMDFASHVDPIEPVDATPSNAYQSLMSNATGERAMEDASLARKLGMDSGAFRYGSDRDKTAILASSLAALSPEQRSSLKSSKLGDLTSKFISSERERQDRVDQGVAGSLIDLMRSGRVYSGKDGRPVQRVQKEIQDPNNPFGPKIQVETEEPLTYEQTMMFARAQKKGLLPDSGFDFAPRPAPYKGPSYAGYTGGYSGDSYSQRSAPVAPSWGDSARAILPAIYNSAVKTATILPDQVSQFGPFGKVSDKVPDSSELASKLAALKAYFFRPNQ